MDRTRHRSSVFARRYLASLIASYLDGQEFCMQMVTTERMNSRAGVNGVSLLNERVGSTREAYLPTQGEIEAAVCDGFRKLEMEFLGRGPDNVRARLVGNTLHVCLTGVLTEAEKRLAGSSDRRAIELIREVRAHLMDLARPKMVSMVEITTGVNFQSLVYEIDALKGDEFVVCTLESAPQCRQPKRK